MHSRKVPKSVESPENKSALGRWQRSCSVARGVDLTRDILVNMWVKSPLRYLLPFAKQSCYQKFSFFSDHLYTTHYSQCSSTTSDVSSPFRPPIRDEKLRWQRPKTFNREHLWVELRVVPSPSLCRGHFNDKSFPLKETAKFTRVVVSWQSYRDTVRFLGAHQLQRKIATGRLFHGLKFRSKGCIVEKSEILLLNCN